MPGESRSSYIAVYPGSFDPITYGHVDIALRAKKLFGKVVVAVSAEPPKETLFDAETRFRLVEEALEGVEGIEVRLFRGLLVDFVRSVGAVAIVRGMRAVSDFEYEFKMAWMNRRLCPEIETVFLIPSEEYAYLSSSLVKEIASLGGDITSMVPRAVAEALRERFGR